MNYSNISTDGNLHFGVTFKICGSYRNKKNKVVKFELYRSSLVDTEQARDKIVQEITEGLLSRRAKTFAGDLKVQISTVNEKITPWVTTTNYGQENEPS